jgi:predicted metal-dependent peptidase|tara:strand:+ start:525 stop:1712 length:1188 start_codon:yes stop_codon:yes gene_type:complete
MATFTPKEKITKAKIQLQKDSPFFAHLVMNMSIKEDTNIPTMGVNFEGNAIYNPEFIDKLTDLEVKGVLCHETMHVALQHLLRLGKRDMMLWNVAADMIINYMILSEGFSLPKGVLIPKNGYTVYSINGKNGTFEIDVKEKSAEEIYEYLSSNTDKIDVEVLGEGQFDSHEYGDHLSEPEKQAIAKEWQGKLVDAATAAKARGKLPSYIDRMMDDILNPKLNWKALLYQYLTKDILYNFTFKRPGRRSYSTGFYMPYEIKENLNITCTIDCSGSISKTEYTEYMSEIIGIANAFEQINMDIIFWDTEIRQVEKVTRGNQQKLLKMEIPGGGGTYISCLDEHFKDIRPPQLMVHLTDGYVESSPKLPYSKHLFVVSEHGDQSVVEQHGKVFKIHGK